MFPPRKALTSGDFCANVISAELPEMTLFPIVSDLGAPPTPWKAENRGKPPADAHEIRRFAMGGVGFHDRGTGLAYAVVTTVRAERSV